MSVFVISWRNMKKGILYGILLLVSSAVLMYLTANYEFPDWPYWVPVLILFFSLLSMFSLVMGAYHLSRREVTILDDRMVVKYGSAFMLLGTRSNIPVGLYPVNINDLFEEYIGPVGVREIPFSEIVSFSVSRDYDRERVLYIERRSPLGDTTFKTRIYESDIGEKRFDALLRAVHDLAVSKRIKFEDKSTYASARKVDGSAYDIR